MFPHRKEDVRERSRERRHRDVRLAVPRPVWPTGPWVTSGGADTSDQAACPNAHRTCGDPAASIAFPFHAKARGVFPGTNPRYEATLEAFGNRSTSSSAATNRADVTGPTPGTVIRRRMRASSHASALSSASASPICSLNVSSVTSSAFKMGRQTFGIDHSARRTFLGKLSGVALRRLTRGAIARNCALG